MQPIGIVQYVFIDIIYCNLYFVVFSFTLFFPYLKICKIKDVISWINIDKYYMVTVIQ